MPVTGSQIVRQRRERQPTASVSTTTVMTWIVVGIQPCIREVKLLASNCAVAGDVDAVT